MGRTCGGLGFFQWRMLLFATLMNTTVASPTRRTNPFPLPNPVTKVCLLDVAFSPLPTPPPQAMSLCILFTFALHEIAQSLALDVHKDSVELSLVDSLV